MKFAIKNRRTSNVQFEAEIEATDDTPWRVKAGLAVKWAFRNGAVLSDADLSGAILHGADLSGADLRDADLSRADLRDAVLSDADLSGAILHGADLSGADLRDADLRGAVLRDAVLSDADLRDADLHDAVLRDAVLRDADLRGAVLRGAVLSRADLRGAVLCGADLRDVPLIPNIDAAIMAAIDENKSRGTNGLDMTRWHGGECDESNWCNTTHCRAGYAICLAGKAGFDLERKIGPAAAATLLYLKSTPDAPVPDWAASNSDAMADIRARAAQQIAGSAR